MKVLNNTINQLDLIDIYKTRLPKNRIRMFSIVHGIFAKTDGILGHKTLMNLKELKAYKRCAWIIMELG